MSAANNLIKEFCQSIGMEGLQLDANKQCSLSFDDKVVLTFLSDDLGDNLTCLCYVAELGKPEGMRILLEQNFLPEANGGARYSLEPGTERVVASRVWSALKTSVPEFSNDVEAFVNGAMATQKWLQDGTIPTSGIPGKNQAPATASPPDSISMAHQAY